MGVYLPSLLTILGLVMYLRFGWIVGNIGLGLTILTVLLASSITLITGLSASAIATNMMVGAGGEYYLISRSLGLELGGAIGIPLYLCRTLSVTFYSFGLAEAIAIFIPQSYVSETIFVQIIAALIVVSTTLLSGKSASLVLKLQIPILIAVVISLFALVGGVIDSGLGQPQWEATYKTAPEGYWYVFAVFFPAVTGFTAGIGLSGDLKDPQKSIPIGTLGAILTGLALYLFVPIILASSTSLTSDFLADSGIESWTTVALLGGLFIYPAIWGAILSSAFGSILGGPRVLQALANDGLAPSIFAKLSKTGQPMLATWVSGAVALLAVLLGGLNEVAQFVSVLFLTLYVMINLSAVLENLVDDPSYRPTIGVPWYVSLIGAFGAIAVMFLISPWACLLAVLFEVGLYMYLQSKKMEKEWGDVRAGFWYNLARFALINHRPQVGQSRNWRPSILAFSAEIEGEIEQIRLACWLAHNSGVVTACHIVEGDLTDEFYDIEPLRRRMSQEVRKHKLAAFSEVNIVKDYETGAVSIAQANGIAGIKSNTALFGWAGHVRGVAKSLRIIRAMNAVGISSLLTKVDWNIIPGTTKSIDIWWRGENRNGDLMLLFAYLMQTNQSWKDATISIRSIVEERKEKRKIERQLKSLLPKIRIRAEVEVVIKKPEEKIKEIVQRMSKNTNLTFLGMQIPPKGSEESYAESLIDMTTNMKTVVFVLNSEKTVPVLLQLESELT